MAFFDFDRKIQTIIIASTIATASACGGGESLSGDTGIHPDTVDVDTDWGHGDPPPDAFEVPDTRPEPGPECPNPGEWEVSIDEHSMDGYVLTLRIRLNVPPEFLHESEPVFTVEKKTIEAVRSVSANEYEIDYRWSGPLEYYWWDWDRLNVSWHAACFDEYGAHSRVVEARTVICVGEGYIYLGWDDDPEMACAVVDCIPDPYEARNDVSPDDGSDGPTLLPRGILKTKIQAAPAPGGGVRLRARTSGTAGGASFEWSASAGTLDTSGGNALWHPPPEPGVHTVQVTVISGAALVIEAYRHNVKT